MRRTILAVVSFSLLAASSAGAALDGDWTEIAVGDLSTGGLARSGDDLYIVWKDWMTDSIMFLRHDGNSPPMVMSGGTGFTAHPRVYANGGDVHVAWVEDQTLYVRTSRNRGATFGPAIAVSHPHLGGPASITFSSGRLYISWAWTEDDEIGGAGVVVSKDRGSSFSAPIRLDDPTRGHGDTRIVAHGADVHVLWDDSWRNDDPSIRIRSSRNHGKTFSPLQIISTDLSDWSESYVGNAHAHGNRILVHWDQTDQNFGGSFDRWRSHFFARSLDRGNTFASTVLASGGHLELGPGQMAASKKHVAFVWEAHASDDILAPSELFLRESFDWGATFGPPMDLTQSPATWSRLLGVDVDGDKTHVIWREAPTAPGGFEWFRGMTIQNGVPGPFVHLMDDTIDVDVSAFSTVDGHIDILVIEDTPSGERLLYRHGFGSMH